MKYYGISWHAFVCFSLDVKFRLKGFKATSYSYFWAIKLAFFLLSKVPGVGRNNFTGERVLLKNTHFFVWAQGAKWEREKLFQSKSFIPTGKSFVSRAKCAKWEPDTSRETQSFHSSARLKLLYSLPLPLLLEKTLNFPHESNFIRILKSKQINHTPYFYPEGLVPLGIYCFL